LTLVSHIDRVTDVVIASCCVDRQNPPIEERDASETNPAVGEMELAEAVVKDPLRLRWGCPIPNDQRTGDVGQDLRWR